MKLFNKEFKADLCEKLKEHEDRIEEWRSNPEDAEALYAYSAMYADEFVEPIADEEIKTGKLEGGVIGAIVGLLVSSTLFVLCNKSKKN